MRARQVSEEEAFAVLRAASMHSNRRVGQVSQQVIAAAHYADAVNRAGKLRMLSQRFVKATALRLLDRDLASVGGQLDDTTRQIDATIAALAGPIDRPGRPALGHGGLGGSRSAPCRDRPRKPAGELAPRRAAPARRRAAARQLGPPAW
jgi:hypothetical protein